jgi:opacity protein-like surface antigen
MKKRFLVVLMIGCLSAPAAAATFSLKAAYFLPSEQAFKDIYIGGAIYGGEIGFRVAGPFGLWIDGMYFQGKGELTYTKEETKLTLIPIGAGVRVDFMTGGLAPYGGAGLRYYMYKETNVIGTAEANGAGLVGFAGVKLRVAKGFFFDLRAAYSYCKLTPADFTVNVGGLELGGGLLFEF